MNSETHRYTLGGKGGLPYEYGASSLLQFCLWGELSSVCRVSCLRGELSLGRVVIQIVVCNSFGSSYDHFFHIHGKQARHFMFGSLHSELVMMCNTNGSLFTKIKISECINSML